MTTDRDTQDRNHHGRFTKTLESVERDREACRLRSRGMTYQAISDALGYGDEANARRAVKEVLTAVRVEGATELRTLMAAQLDYLTAQALEVLEAVHPVVTQSGRIVRDEEGNLLVDDGPRLAAIDRLLKIQERRAKLLGLDSPTLAGEDGDMDAEIQELLEQLGVAAADGADGEAS